jgi:Bacteriophage head to tail connecting protein
MIMATMTKSKRNVNIKVDKNAMQIRDAADATQEVEKQPLPDGYGLSKTAKALFGKLHGERSNVIEQNIELAEVTIPRLFPDASWKEGMSLYVPNQSINSDAVNNWSNVLVYAGFPPGQPMYAANIIEHKLTDQEAQDQELFSKLIMALSRVEESHRKRLEATTTRTAYAEYLKLLCVTGNALWKHTTLNHPTYHNMHSYVVKRDNLGRPIYCILREALSHESIPASDMHLFKSSPTSKAEDDTCWVYTVCRWEYPLVSNASEGEYLGTWYYWQETETGHILSETMEDGDEVLIPSPLYPGWCIPNIGGDWGWAYCEDYRGDLFQVENDHNALNDGASVASWTLALVNPTGVTSAETIRTAENTDVVSGSADDVSFLQTNKGGDYNIVMQHADNAERRIARAFLKNISVQRQAERVTKEEIVRVSQDIDRAMGGLHTQIAQTSQKHIIRRFIYLHEQEDSALPEMPKEIVQLSVITGVDSLGRSVDYDNLITVAQDASAVLTPAVVAQAVNPRDFMRRLMAYKSIKPEGLVKTEEQQAQDQQQAQQDQMMSQVAGPVAGQAAKAAGDMATQAATQQQPQQ